MVTKDGGKYTDKCLRHPPHSKAILFISLHQIWVQHIDPTTCDQVHHWHEEHAPVISPHPPLGDFSLRSLHIKGLSEAPDALGAEAIIHALQRSKNHLKVVQFDNLYFVDSTFNPQ
jgi:hypothetical protein